MKTRPFFKEKASKDFPEMKKYAKILLNSFVKHTFMQALNFTALQLIGEGLSRSSSLIHFHFFLADFLSFFYILVKTYRMLCYCKLLMDQMPLFNPYIWPLSTIRIITNPYFNLFNKLLPNFTFGRYTFSISVLLCLEFLGAILSFILRFKMIVLSHVDSLLAQV